MKTLVDGNLKRKSKPQTNVIKNISEEMGFLKFSCKYNYKFCF